MPAAGYRAALAVGAAVEAVFVRQFGGRFETLAEGGAGAGAVECRFGVFFQRGEDAFDLGLVAGRGPEGADRVDLILDLGNEDGPDRFADQLQVGGFGFPYVP